MMGFYVIRDYQPSLTTKMPDVSAFRTPEIHEMIETLRRKKLLKYGAANEEPDDQSPRESRPYALDGALVG